MTEHPTRRAAVAATGLYLLGIIGMAVVEMQAGVEGPDWMLAVLGGFPVALGLLVTVRAPSSPAGVGLVLLGAAPTAVGAVEAWGRTAASPAALPFAGAIAPIGLGVWVFNLTGFVVLASTFPSGRQPGRRWAVLPVAFVADGTAMVGVLALQPDGYVVHGGDVPGTPPFELRGPLNATLLLGCAASLLSVLALSVAAVVRRFRAGDEVVRTQLRWFALGAGSVPVLLVAGWVAEALSAPLSVAYAPFSLAILVLMPSTVAVSVLRHDLFDIDRVLHRAIADVLTTAVAAGLFAGVVTAIAHSGAQPLHLSDSGGVAAAAFITALALQPLHRWLHRRVGRIVDPDRSVALRDVRAFVDDVRDGRAEPEAIEAVLRQTLDDPGLELFLDVPGDDGRVRLDGSIQSVIPRPDDGRTVTVRWRDRVVGVVVLGRTSKRRVRLVGEALIEARLAIDVSRLRLELRQALEDARASRLRLVEAAAIERRRLERDLHDGAQQQLLAVGMRLRTVQRRLPDGDPSAAELDQAVASLEATVMELRRLAHGMRPALLDDGLGTALQRLVGEIPIPVDLVVDRLELSEPVAATAYFVVAEAVANVLKHAEADHIDIAVRGLDAGVSIRVVDDGTGTVQPGRGLTALADRVAALGGTLTVQGQDGQGTALHAVL